MIDSVQLVLLLIIITLTVLLVVLGVQVFFILRDIGKAVTKANKVLDNAHVITDSISVPFASFASLTTGLKTGSFLALVKLIRAILSKDDGGERKKE